MSSQTELTEKQKRYFKPYQPRYRAADWDQLRLSAVFVELLELPPSALFPEIMGKTWPGKKREEGVQEMLEYSYEELVGKLGFKAKEIDLVIDLIHAISRNEKGEKDLVESERVAKRTEDAYLQTLTKFGVRADLPIEFMAFDWETRNHCEENGIQKAEDILQAILRTKEPTTLPGVLQKLVNALSAESEYVLCQILPFLPGEIGLCPWRCLEFGVGRVPRDLRPKLAAHLRGEPQQVTEAEKKLFDENLAFLKDLHGKFSSFFPGVVKDLQGAAGTETGNSYFGKIEDPTARELSIAVASRRPSDEQRAIVRRENVSFIRSLFGKKKAH